MEPLAVVRGTLTPVEILRALWIGVSLTYVLSRGKTITSRKAQAATSSGFAALFLFGRSWLALVNYYVPEPYLDEFFHIPQAQTYCEGRYWDWDDKITTPPGLYAISIAYHRFSMMAKCTASSLRHTNLLATMAVALVAAQCRSLLQAQSAKNANPAPGAYLSAFHTGLNIALFPVIFFFSGLYYTDVVSTLAVLYAYQSHLLRLGEETPGLRSDLDIVACGVFALFMRQTNVFWVVVYMGATEAVHAIRSLKPTPVESPKGSLSFVERAKFHAWRASVGEVHDPKLNNSHPEDWLFCVLSIGIAALCNPLLVLKQIRPHLTILFLFASFVAWNGGVVLGDKTNHIATLHLPQTLYLFPFLAFFSFPLLLPSLLSPLRTLSRLFTGRPTPPGTTASQTVYYAPYHLLTTLLSLLAVKHNTIIHPFTLADNRHYMFYIFRYTILRSARVRYALVAAYTATRWLVWDALAGFGSPSTPSPADSKVQPGAPSTSTAIFWLLATTLSLVTAPLVEPRYFILPWVFWRLLVPAWDPAAAAAGGGSKWPLRKLAGWGVDPRVALETAWFVAINLGTMYMFLFRPFYWRGADGEVLDGGRVQRFMW
ncbi:glycosyltransferase [Podospora conica]|nr:glycosyltransferase [Schizothecium conicum]